MTELDPGGGAPPDEAATSQSLGREELRAAARSGVRWVAVSRVAYEIVSFAATIVLVRLVSPAETGAAAVALAVPMLATILTFEGFGSALVQREHVTQGALRTATALSLGSGVVFAAIAAGFAIGLAPELFSDRTAELMLFASPSFLIAGTAAVPRARLQRRLDFRALSMNDVIGTVTNFAVAIPMAALGTGGAALVVGLVAGQAGSAVALGRAAGLVRPQLDRREASGLWAYGLPAATSGLVFSARKVMPWAVLGAVMTPSAVGFLYRAYQLGAEYQQKVTSVLLGIAFPLLSRAGSRSEVRRLRGRMIRLNALALTPVLGLLVICAPEAVQILYGDRWVSIDRLVQVLAIAGLAQVLMSGTEAVALALGRPRTLLVFHGTFGLVMLAALLVVGSEGELAVAVALSAVHVVMLLLGQWMVLGRVAGVRFGELAADALPALVATGAAMTVGALVAATLRGSGSGALLIGVATGGVIAAVYLLTLRLCFPRSWNEVRGLPGMMRG